MHQTGWVGLTLHILISVSQVLAAACCDIPSSQHRPHLPAVPPPIRVTLLAQDWDVFYLQIGCCHKLGRNVSTHLVPVFGTAGAMAYMMTPAFAS